MGAMTSRANSDGLDVEDVARALELTPATVDWLARIDRPDGAPSPELPDDAEADRLLRRLDIGSEDRMDTLAARPDPAAHPELWWILDRAYHLMLATMGRPVPIEGFPGYPGLPASAGPVARHLPVWMYLALLPETRGYHSRRGIPDELSWDSLADALGRVMRAHRASTGASGLALWGFGWTLPLRFRGADFQLGKLGFNRGVISLSNGACGHAVAVHIPAEPPLDPAACDESFTRAREFFPRHFPEEPVTFFTCSSWLMDPQLSEYLPDSSNIVQFQRRFQLLPLTADKAERTDGDRDVEAYVFGRSFDRLDDYPQDTTLQRAYVTHRRADRHWHGRTGWTIF